MARTQLSTRELTGIQRNDIDIITTGQALVTKLIAGTNITFASTGVDAGTGDVTINGTSLSAIGATPNANGATITAGVLNLQPASLTFGGVVTTAAQTFAGLKTFSGNILVSALLSDASEHILKNSSGFNAYSFNHDNVANFAINFSIANLTSTKTISVPDTSGTLAVSVNGQITNTAGAVTLTAANVGAEPALGNPATTGFVLSSTLAGVRSWVAQGGGGSSKWTDVGTGNIYRNSKVSINKTSDPAYELDVQGQLRVNQTGIAVATAYALSVQSTATTTWFEILNSGGTGKGAFFGMNINDFQIWNYQAGPINFYTTLTAGSGGTSKMTIADNGQITILSLDTDLTAPTQTGTVRMVTTDGTGLLSWQAIPIAITRSILNIAVNTTAAAAAFTDYIYLGTGTFTFTLPTAIGNTNRYLIKNVGTGVITLAFTLGQNAEGDTSATFSAGQGIEVISDNTNYVQIGY